MNITSCPLAREDSVCVWQSADLCQNFAFVVSDNARCARSVLLCCFPACRHSCLIIHIHLRVISPRFLNCKF